MNIDFTLTHDYVVSTDYCILIINCMEVSTTGEFIRFLNYSDTGFYFTVTTILKEHIKSIFLGEELIYHV